MVGEILVVPDAGDSGSAREGARYVAKGLTAVGIKVRESVSLCEDATELGQAISTALSRSNVIAIIGGLDSRSGFAAKNVICGGLDLSLEVNRECLDAITGYCAKTGEKFLPEDERLADMPRGAKVIPPSFGKTPGCIISSSSQHIILIPPLKQELTAMFGKYIGPFLSGLGSAMSVVHVIRAYGVREEYVRDKLAELLRAPNPAVTLKTDGNEVLIRVESYAGEGRDAAGLCAPVLREIARRMGDAAYGLDVDSIQSAAVGKMLKKDLGLAIAEAGTMGMLTRVVGETPGGQEILRYSTVADDDEAKVSKLEALPKLIKKHGGVSEYAAAAMAAGARSKAGASIGIGIAANASDFEDKKSFPGLVYIAVCDRENVYIKKLVIGDGGAPDDVIIDAAVSRALNMLRLFVDYLPGAYKGCTGLAGVLEGKTGVTDRDSYEDDINGVDGHEKPGGSKRKVRKLVLLAATLVFLGCGGYLGVNYYQSHSARQQAETLSGLYEYDGVDEVEVSPEFPEEYLNGFGALWTINSDTVGFISVKGTQVRYPVVQSDDNDYYLRKDFYQNKNNHGIPFMDYRVDIERPSENIVIYGHNMKDGQIFGELLGYKTLDYYKEHPTINFDTLYRSGEYRIYSVFITNADENQGDVFPYHDFIDQASPEDFENYVKQLRVRSIIDTGVSVEPGDELLTLSTCTYEFDDARFVIAARRLREGEAPDDGADTAAMNREPLYPDIWYETFGGEKPAGVDGGATVTTRPVKNTPDESISEDESSDIDSSIDETPVSEADSSIPASQGISAQEISASAAIVDKSASDIAVQSLAAAAASDKAASDKAASDKAASDKAASDKAALDKAASDKAASDKAASDKAALDKAASDKAASDKAASDKAASSKAVATAAEADAASAAAAALAAAKKAESEAGLVMEAGYSEEARAGLEAIWEHVVKAQAHAGEAGEAADKAGTGTAEKSAATAVEYASRAEKAFENAELYYIELTAMEKAEKDKNSQSSSSSQTQSSQSESTVSTGGAQTAAAGSLTVKSNGKVVTGDAVDIISRVVQTEMGSNFHAEALKAQAVAAYSYIIFHTQSGTVPSVILASKADAKVINAVSGVIGQTVYYNGRAAFTPYFATSAGATTSSASVWGGSYPYLVSVDSSVDSSITNFKSTTSLTREKVESLIASKLGIGPDGDPAYWFEVLSQTDGGYNDGMSVCGYTKTSSGTRITGRLLREQVFNIRSACFTVDYDEASDKFIFTTYGYGHGVGMSQNGANLYASREGWSYTDILNHYYPGTSVR